MCKTLSNFDYLHQIKQSFTVYNFAYWGVLWDSKLFQNDKEVGQGGKQEENIQKSSYCYPSLKTLCQNMGQKTESKIFYHLTTSPVLFEY